MVLEKLVSVREAIKRPWWMFIVGGIVSTTSLLIASVLLPILPNDIGFFTSILITFAMTPFMVNLFSYEEAKTEGEILRGNENFFQRHKQVFLIYIAFFAGVTLSMSLIYLIVPEKYVEKIFEDQIETIRLIRGSSVVVDSFQRIVFNNISVLIVSFLFSFLYGSGAIFILSWNASVLATAIGLTAKSIGGLKGLPIAMLVYFPHGSIEILAYFIAGISGGIISTAISRRKSPFLNRILIDSLSMLAIASILIIIAGAIEVAGISLR